MRKTLLALPIPMALTAAVCALLGRSAADAAPAKNLKIYPKGTDTSVIKKDMKEMSKALGVECDFCHDLDAFDKDLEHKKVGRTMMKLTATINTRLKKDGFKDEVRCVTCHAGEKKPKRQ